MAELGLHRIELGYSGANQASCRVPAKAEYQLEATLHAAPLHTQGWHYMHLHATIAGDPGPSGHDAGERT
jgi:RimJ/RimL family protein N-acetyltransferase